MRVLLTAALGDTSTGVPCFKLLNYLVNLKKSFIRGVIIVSQTLNMTGMLSVVLLGNR